MHDTTIQVIALEVESGEDHVLVTLIEGMNIPVGQDPNTGQLIMGQIPCGATRWRMGRDAAIEHGEAIRAAGEALPEPKPQSDLIVANDLAAVDRAAKMAQQFRGPQQG